MDERKGHLDLLMIDLNNSVGVTERKYFHVKTTENMIFHFDRIRTENDKKWVYETLVEYFKKCSEYTPSIDRGTSKSLFFEYLDKITDYYHNNLGFSVLMNRTIVYLVYLLILGLCYYFLNIYVTIGIIIFFSVQIIRAIQKYKQKIVYGLFL